jgi:hypothetical protein
MEREYFQHAIQEAIASATTISTHVIGFATSGLIVFYMLRAASVATEMMMPFECFGLLMDHACGPSEVGSFISQNDTL